MIGKFCGSTGGNVTLISALMGTAIMGAIGVGMDGANAVRVKNEMQQAADAAALAGMALQNVDIGQRIQEASQVFRANLSLTQSTEPLRLSVKVDDLSSTVAAEKYRVTVDVAYDFPTRFGKLVGYGDLPIRARAVAEPIDASPICVLALDTTAPEALRISGNATLIAEGCSVQANSVSPTAISVTGAGTAKAVRICTSGGGAGATEPGIQGACDPVPDPFVALPKVTSDKCDHNGLRISKTDLTLSPGTYCGGLEVLAHAKVQFEPGVYVMEDGPLLARAHSGLFGSGVTIYLTGTNSRLQIHGGADFQISAPKEGDFAAVAVAQDLQSSPGQTSVAIGGGTIEIEGAVYLPSQTLEIGGGGIIDIASDYMPLIANKVHVRGNGVLRLGADHTVADYPDHLPYHRRTIRLTQ